MATKVKANWRDKATGVPEADFHVDAAALNALALAINATIDDVGGKQAASAKLTALAALAGASKFISLDSQGNLAGLAAADARNLLDVYSRSETAQLVGGSSGGTTPTPTPSSDVDVYNWKPTNTRRIQRSLGKAMGSDGYSDHLIIGDSQSSSFTGSSGSAGGPNFGGMWSRKMRDVMPLRGVPLGGTGWVFANDTTGINDPRWTFTGNWADGYGYRATQQAGAVTATFTADVPGTVMSLAYFDVAFAASFQVSVDGGSAVTITPSDGNGKVSVWNSPALSSGIHTLKVSGNAQNVFLLAGACTAGSGFRLQMFAQQGARATTTWGASSFAGFTNRAFCAKSLLPDPDVLHISIGPNDLGNGTSSADVITALQAIRNQWPNADCILYAQYETAVTSTWPSHVPKLYQLADSMNVPLVDLYRRSGGLTKANGFGMYLSDGIHLALRGEADWGLLVANTLLKAM